MKQTAKQQQRVQLKRRRRQLTVQQKTAFDRQIAQRLQTLDAFRAASVVFIYLATAAEISTRALIEHCLAEHKTLLVPRLTDGKMIATRFTGWDTLKKGPLGILTPQSNTAYPGTIDISITPGLSFSTDGRRLGYGKGYYDRWFSTHPRVTRIALGYECLLHDAIPRQAHDVLMEVIVTEQRLIIPT